MVSENDQQVLEAQAHIWNHMFNFMKSMSLKCAIELGIPEVIHKHARPMTLPELLAELPIHPTKAPHVPRLMHILSHNGFFAVQKLGHDREGYVLTHASRLLLKDNPFGVSPFVLAMLDPCVTTPWQAMATWYKNDVPTPFENAHGMPPWQYPAREPEYGGLFNEAMASDSRLVVSVVTDKCKDVFDGVKTLVDVGGGTGTMAKGIANAFPDLECTVFDLPRVVAASEDCKNLKFLGGDMFEAIPSSNAILLKWILHDWSDEECVKILKKCKEAITSNGAEGGKVIIIEIVVGSQKEDDKALETQLLFDMLMMGLVTGRERNEEDLAKLFSYAGFSDYKITPILGLRSLIEVYP